MNRKTFLVLTGVLTLLLLVTQTSAGTNFDTQNQTYTPVGVDQGSWNYNNQTMAGCVSPDTIVTAAQDTISTHHQWDQPQLDPLILDFNGNDFSAILSIDSVSLTFYWYSYSYAGFGINMMVENTQVEVTPFYNPDAGLTRVWVYDTFDITSLATWNQSVLDNFVLEISKTVYFDNSIGIDYVGLNINGDMTFSAMSEEFGSWNNNKPSELTCLHGQDVLSEIDGGMVTHEWTQNPTDNNPLEITFNLDYYSQIDEMSIQFYWYAYSYAGFGIEIYVDNSWTSVVDYFNPDPGLTVVWVQDSFDIKTLSNWESSDFSEFKVRIVKSTYFDNTIGIEQVKVDITGSTSDVVIETVTETETSTNTVTDTSTDTVTDTSTLPGSMESVTVTETSMLTVNTGNGSRTPQLDVDFPYVYAIVFLPILVAITRKRTK